jgi:hypothetical protein
MQDPARMSLDTSRSRKSSGQEATLPLAIVRSAECRLIDRPRRRDGCEAPGDGRPDRTGGDRVVGAIASPIVTGIAAFNRRRLPPRDAPHPLLTGIHQPMTEELTPAMSRRRRSRRSASRIACPRHPRCVAAIGRAARRGSVGRAGRQAGGAHESRQGPRALCVQ